MQVYIEPVVPTPHLVVVGRSPMAHTLADLAPALGWRAECRTTDRTSRAADLDARSIVVVATQGHGDEEAIEQAVSALPGVRRPGRLPQAGRGGARHAGRPRRRRGTCSTGSGCRSGSTSATPRTARSPWPSWPNWCSGGPPASSLPEPSHADAPADRSPRRVDPVCGMTVRADASSHPFEHDGVTYYFCCAGCRAASRRTRTVLPSTRHPGGLMLIKNDFEVAQPVDKVWQFFDDIPQVAACLPGTELTEDLGDNKYNGRVAIRMGPVKLQFAGTAQIKERDDAAKRIVVDAAGADEKGRGQAAMSGTATPGAGSRRHPGRRRAGPAAVRRRRPVRPRHDLRRHRDPDARLRHQHAGPHRRRSSRGLSPDQVGSTRSRRAASPSGCARCGWRSAACCAASSCPTNPTRAEEDHR